MAKKAKKKEETFPVRKFRVKPSEHPIWETGKPVLIGDPAHHQEYGACVVSKVERNKVTIVDKNKVARSVDIAEVWFQITQVPHLVDAERFGVYDPTA